MSKIKISIVIRENMVSAFFEARHADEYATRHPAATVIHDVEAQTSVPEERS